MNYDFLAPLIFMLFAFGVVAVLIGVVWVIAQIKDDRISKIALGLFIIVVLYGFAFGIVNEVDIPL